MHNNSRTKFYLALVVVAIPFTFLWMDLIREVVAENQTILANSTVAEAVVTGTTQSRSRRTGTSYWVKYRYSVGGMTYEGSSSIDSDSVKKAVASGRVEILYEIERPSQSHLRDRVEMMSFIPSTRHLVMVAYVLALIPSVCLNGAYVWLTKRFPQLPNPYRKSTT